jgi:hypothetical protein
VGTDDGKTFAAVLETGVRDAGDPIHSKYIRTMRFLGRGQVTAELKRDFKPDVYKAYNLDMSAIPGTDLWSMADTWGGDNWGPDSLLKEELVNPDAYGRYFQLRFSDKETTISRRILRVGTREYSLESGEWAIFSVVLDGTILGVRA